MPSKVWDEITYPFPNFNCAIVEVWEWVSNFTPYLYVIRNFIIATVDKEELQILKTSSHVRQDLLRLCFQDGCPWMKSTVTLSLKMCREA